MVKRLSFIFLFLLPFLTCPTLVHAGGKADAIAGYLAGNVEKTLWLSSSVQGQ